MLLEKSLTCKNETKKKITIKSVHITLLALLLIQVLVNVFLFLYYSDMFMLFSSGKCGKVTKHKGEIRPEEVSGGHLKKIK